MPDVIPLTHPLPEGERYTLHTQITDGSVAQIANGGFARRLEIVLPLGGHAMVMVEGYFDESGDLDTDKKVFCVSGYFLTSENAKIMDQKWGEVLAEHELPYFHMVDCAHGNGVFKGKTSAERSLIVAKLIQLIKAYTLEGFSFVANGAVFAPPADEPDIYSTSVEACVFALQIFLQTQRIKGDIAYFFETGHKNRHRAYNHVAEKLGDASQSITFAGKEKVRLLQAADLLAWQTTKYIKDASSGKRGPRKDFASLMEHHHMFCHPVWENGEKSMGVEIWPISKRSPVTTSISLKTDGPITFLLEDGDDIPIVPIGWPVGWRKGAAGMVYLAVEGVDKKQFYLSFEQASLVQTTLAMLAAATDIYKESGAAVIPLKGAAVGETGESSILQLELSNESILRFRLPNDVVQQLKKDLK